MALATNVLDGVTAAATTGRRALLFDETACETIGSVSCGAEIAAVLPWGRVFTALKWVRRTGEAADTIRDVDRAINAACSFNASTRVLMADGQTKRIDQVKIGDFVIATNPETGETGIRAVVAIIPHTDQLLTLRTSSGDIVTTEDHLYWNSTDSNWQESQDLDAGDRLLTLDGDIVTVEGLDWSTVHTDEAYDLTISDLHTFYVSAGSEAVLVHNCLANQMSHLLDDELATAARLGVKPTEVGSAGFDALANGGRMKFAVLQDGRVVVQPLDVAGEEISHAVLSGGAPVQVAGHVDIVGAGGNYFGLSINAQSGHFGSGDVDAAREAFARYGIYFD